MNTARTTLTIMLLLPLATPLPAQWAESPLTGSQPQTLPDRTVIAGQAGLGPLMTAELVDRNANAEHRRAIVDVHTDGVQLVNPGGTGSSPSLAQAHIQYWLDNGQTVSTTSRRFQLDNLSPGQHQIHVALVGNDNKPLGHQTTLNLHVPD